MILPSIVFFFFSNESQEVSQLNGKFESGQYKNEYFGFEITIPDSWYVQHDIDFRNKNESLIDAQPLKLLDCLKFQPHIEVDCNPNLIVGVLKIPFQNDIYSGEDIHLETREALNQKDSDVSFPRDIYEYTIGSVVFYVLEMDVNHDGKQMKVKQYATVIKGHAFMINLTCCTEGELQGLDSIVETMNFNLKT